MGDVRAYPEILFVGPDPFLVDTLSTITSVSTDTTISVPAGTYRCCKYRLVGSDPNVRAELYFSPGFGWIRSDTYATYRPGGGTFLIHQSLTSAISTVP